MASQFNGKSAGTTNPQTRPYRGDDQDWNPKMEDVEVSGREYSSTNAVSRHEFRRDPVEYLKARLSMWGM